MTADGREARIRVRVRGQEPEQGPEQAAPQLTHAGTVPEGDGQLWTSDGRMVRMYTPAELVTTRTDPDGTVAGCVEEPAPWHPRWCQTRWCTAWFDGERGRHRVEPYVFAGVGHVLYSLFVEADGYGVELCMRLVGAAPPYQGDWWAPEEGCADVVWSLRAAERFRDALGDQLAGVRAELAGGAEPGTVESGV